MFIAEVVTAQARYSEAAARLADVINAGALRSASEAAYQDGRAELLRAGALGPAWELPNLALVRHLQPIQHTATMTAPIRWEAAGTGGELFPVLDADLTMTPDGDSRIRLRLAGAFRPLSGWGDIMLLGAPISRRFASATVRSLLRRITEAVAGAVPQREPEAPGLDGCLPNGASVSFASAHPITLRPGEAQ
jgi:hypothetical protein